jgi:hypothetical protein
MAAVLCMGILGKIRPTPVRGRPRLMESYEITDSFNLPGIQFGVDWDVK